MLLTEVRTTEVRQIPFSAWYMKNTIGDITENIVFQDSDSGVLLQTKNFLHVTRLARRYWMILHTILETACSHVTKLHSKIQSEAKLNLQARATLKLLFLQSESLIRALIF